MADRFVEPIRQPDIWVAALCFWCMKQCTTPRKKQNKRFLHTYLLMHTAVYAYIVLCHPWATTFVIARFRWRKAGTSHAGRLTIIMHFSSLFRRSFPRTFVKKIYWIRRHREKKEKKWSYTVRQSLKLEERRRVPQADRRQPIRPPPKNPFYFERT